MADLKAGTLTDFGNSMAEAMEHAMSVEWQAHFGVPLPVLGQAERRLMFVAVAQGVVRYLKDNIDAIRLQVSSIETTGTLH